QFVDGERSERALIGEHHRQSSVLRMLDVHPDALMPLGRGILHPQQQLAAHAQVRDHRIRAAFQRKPQELAPARGRGHPTAFEARDEIVRTSRMPGQRALVEDVHGGDPRADDGGREAGAHDLDLGKLRQGSPRKSEAQTTPAAARAFSSRQAVSAAAISAFFLLVPSPVVESSPTTTVAVKTRLWSGPSETTE